MSDSAPPSTFKQAVFADVERELAVTRKVLLAVRADKFDFKPHEKSMNLMRLAIHVADLPEWTRGSLDDDGLNFRTGRRPPTKVADNAELVAYFDAKAAALRDAIQRFDTARWNQPWTIKDGDNLITTQPRPTVYRIWCMNHMIHHRAQLCLYLRLLNIPVPTVYFNTADDPTFRFD